jgi:hypothetical protein
MARKDNVQADITELNPRHGGSYIRHPESGELHPNTDDHVMVARIERGEIAAPKTTTGGEQ